MTETPPKEPLRVGVLGARGRMGSETCRAVDAAEDLDLVAMVEAGDWLFGVADAGAQVVVDFTSPAVVLDNIRWCIDQGIHCVVGTTGFDAERLATVQRWVDEAPGVGVIIAPNFAVGAVLMMRFAQEAVPYMPNAEIVELHDEKKVDAPSGTSKATSEAMGGNVPIHSVRLPGLVAHQEVLLGGPGQLLTIRHDTTSREAFVPGVLLALEKLSSLEAGLTVGLEKLLK
jgi:4-hydroxy-tetrahydrodipicolinate reductase